MTIRSRRRIYRATFKFNLMGMKLTEPATFEVIEIGANMTQMVGVN
ncbi:hypothetical protein [Rickettsia endosymbiont of Cantharis rufa]